MTGPDLYEAEWPLDKVMVNADGLVVGRYAHLTPSEAVRVYRNNIAVLRAMAPTDGPTALYRFFDAAAALLYVGISRRPEDRFKQHAADKSWWPQVAERSVEWFDTRHEALTAESHAIKSESPRHNIAGAA